jgi:hypothetical protein
MWDVPTSVSRVTKPLDRDSANKAVERCVVPLCVLVFFQDVPQVSKTFEIKSCRKARKSFYLCDIGGLEI